MNRLLTLASSGVFATGLAILPISAFAQQTGPDVKPVAPATQTSAPDLKNPAQSGKADPAMKQTTASKPLKSHHVHPASATKAGTPAASNAAVSTPSGHAPMGNAPMGNAATHNGSVDTSSTHSGVPAKTAEPGKS